VESLDEVLDLALGELVEDDAVALVEWGELAASVFGRDVMTIDFLVDDNEGRTLTVGGELAENRVNLLNAWAS
jgi:tRNA A37 threonylcarbamoyladenosine biosynthesis protein TsaE